MKTLRGVLVFATCCWAAGCGTSTTAATNDTVGDQDTAASDATGDDATGDGVVSDVPTTDVLTYKYNTCAAVADCAQAACSGSTSPTCASACLADGSPDGVSGATALLSCVQTKCIADQCKNSTDTHCLADCTSMRCMPQILTCIEDGKTGADGCADVKTCFDSCDLNKTNVFSCLQNCYDGISAAAKAKAKPFADCVAVAPKGTDPTQSCMKETLGCFLDGKTGAKGCFDSIGCLTGCDQASDQFNCALGCFGQMTKPAQDAYIDVAPCLGKDITATAGCEDKLVVCLAPTGTQTCDEALGCIMGCSSGSKNDPVCTFTCLHNTTSAADKLIVEKLGCDQSDPTCAAAIVECLAPNGNATCPAIIGCATKCGGGQGQSPDIKCVLACVKSGNSATATTAFATLNCMGKQGANCGDTAVACYNPTGTAGCYQTTQCVEACYASGGDVGGCQNGCYGNASVQGFKDFQAWSACHNTCGDKCSEDTGCTNTCMQQDCPSAKGACAPT